MDGTRARTGHATGLRRRRWPSRGVFRLALAAGMALVTVMAAAGLVLPREPAAALASPPGPAAPAWIEISQPLRLFDLPGSSFATLPLVYAARRRPDGSARQDTLTFGAFAPTTRYLRVTLAWGADRPATPPDLLVEIARLASGDGVAVMRAGLPASVATRFGPAVTSPLELRRNDVSLPCLGVRLEMAGPRALGLTGVVCGTAAHPVPPTDLACIVDHLALAAAGGDPALREVFVAAERRASACVARPGAAGLRAGA